MAFINSNTYPDRLDDLLVSRSEQPEDTIIEIALPDGSDTLLIGDGSLPVMAGPCTLETGEQTLETAMAVKRSGALFFRGGAFKSRTSPYDFSGLRDEGIALLSEVRKRLNMPVVSEIVNAAHLPLFENVDIIQVGERNMRNAELLSELSHTDKPILLKRSHSATLKELLLSAEYLLAGGNRQVILCERGIRTFEPMTRNTMDISAIPILKELTHLPVIADPSHATGLPRLIRPMSMAAAVAGADGLMIEVHTCPREALCDGGQALVPEEFARLMSDLQKLTPLR
ncbi:MAG: 3-deoxy-7-phosphoheptulonate synthase [Bacillota bacterium]|nr:3-deoxy-7-phosphoheptulonate synthase [Bacillota bacterium]